MAGDVQTIPQLVGQQANARPEQIALVADGRDPLTYVALSAFIHSTAEFLHAKRIGRNDRVAVVLPNGPEMASAFLSISAVATCAPLNPAFREAEFEFYLGDLEAKAVAVKQGAESPVRLVAQRMGIRIVEIAPLLDQAAGLFAWAMNSDPANGISSGTLQTGCAVED